LRYSYQFSILVAHIRNLHRKYEAFNPKVRYFLRYSKNTGWANGATCSISEGRKHIISYAAVNLGRLPRWNLANCFGEIWPFATI